MTSPLNGEQLVTLEKAASLARLPEDVLMEFAILSSEWPEEERLTIHFAPGGPWFDAGECFALGIILDGDESGDLEWRDPPQQKPGAFSWPSDTTLSN